MFGSRRNLAVFFSTFDPMLCLWVHSLSVDSHTTLMLMILHLFVHGLSEKPGPSIRTVSRSRRSDDAKHRSSVWGPDG